MLNITQATVGWLECSGVIGQRPIKWKWQNCVVGCLTPSSCPCRHPVKAREGSGKGSDCLYREEQELLSISLASGGASWLEPAPSCSNFHFCSKPLALCLPPLFDELQPAQKACMGEHPQGSCTWIGTRSSSILSPEPADVTRRKRRSNCRVLCFSFPPC